MPYSNLKEMTDRIYSAIEVLDYDQTDEQDWQTVDCFLQSLKSDIINASDTLSTLPDSMNDESRYLFAVAASLRCYDSFLRSGCMQRVSPYWQEKLTQLVTTDFSSPAYAQCA
jgi:hypothetical protein